MERLTGKTVIVTGAASGIGGGVAERFSVEGGNVVLCDLDETNLKTVVGGLPGWRTLGRRCDMSRFEEVESPVAAAVKPRRLHRQHRVGVGPGRRLGDGGLHAAKNDVVNLTLSIALDFGEKGVRANAVCASRTHTVVTEEMLQDKALVSKFMERLPLKRVAEPGHIAGVGAFLASDDARFVNGVNLRVDGGVTASNGQPTM